MTRTARSLPAADVAAPGVEVPGLFVPGVTAPRAGPDVVPLAGPGRVP
jgi:hypothetical protein